MTNTTNDASIAWQRIAAAEYASARQAVAEGRLNAARAQQAWAATFAADAREMVR